MHTTVAYCTRKPSTERLMDLLIPVKCHAKEKLRKERGRPPAGMYRNNRMDGVLEKALSYSAVCRFF